MDEITAARRKKRRKYNIKRTSRFIAALALLLAAAVAASSFTAATLADIGDFFTTTFAATDGWPVKLGDSEPLQTERLTSAFAVITDSELVVVSRRGARIMDAGHGFISPFIAAEGNRIALCNRGSRDVRVFNRSRELAAFSAEGAIIDAAIASDGTLALLTDSERYTCELSVYKNGLYERAMTWKGAHGFPLLAEISPDGSRAAVVTVSAADGALGSAVTVIDVARERELFSASVDGTILRLILSNDGGFTALTQERAALVNSSGETAEEYSFGGRPLLALAASSGRLALAFGDNGRAAVNSCALLDRGLNELAVIGGCGAVRSLSMSGERVCVLGLGTLTVYNTEGEVIKIYNTDTKAQNIVEFSSIIEILPDCAQKALEQTQTDETHTEGS